MKTISRGFASAPILFAGVLHTGQVLAAPVVSVERPAEAAAVPDVFSIGADVTSPLLISSVTARVQGVSTVLTTRPNDLYRGTLDISSVPLGPIVLEVKATDAASESTTRDVSLVHDHAPTVSVLTVEGSVARTSLRLQAACTDADLYGCATVSATIVNGPVLASANGAALDQVVALDAYRGKALDIEIAAIDTAGLRATKILHVYVDDSPRLHEVARADGPIVDFDATRILFATASGFVIRSRTGAVADTVIDNVTSKSAFLTPLGAIWLGGELRNGIRLTNTAERSLVARNGYAVWASGTESYAQAGWYRDIAADTTTSVVSGGYSVDSADVAANGDAVFGWIPPSSITPRISRYRGGVRTELTTSPSVHLPITDGIQIVYARYRSPQRSALKLFTTVESELSPFQLQGSAVIGTDYQVAGGWVAFTHPPIDHYVVHTRSPDGIVAPATPFAAASHLDALSESGELMYFVYGDGRYQGRAGGGAPTRITEHQLGRSVPVGTGWFVAMGASLFEVGEPQDLDGGVDGGDLADAGDADADADASAPGGSSGAAASSSSSASGNVSSSGGVGGSTSSSTSGGASASGGTSGEPEDDGGCSSTSGATGSSWLAACVGMLAFAGLRRRARSGRS